MPSIDCFWVYNLIHIKYIGNDSVSNLNLLYCMIRLTHWLHTLYIIFIRDCERKSDCLLMKKINEQWTSKMHAAQCKVLQTLIMIHQYLTCPLVIIMILVIFFSLKTLPTGNWVCIDLVVHLMATKCVWM